jgi:hypothetical protein
MTAARRRERERVVELRAAGLTVDEIALLLGLSRRSVCALLRRRAIFAERPCELCGQPFTPTNGRQRYCSTEHRLSANRRTPKPRECWHCGESFFVTGRSGQRYCTPEHRREHARKRADAERAAGWRARVVHLEAEIARVRAELARREAA